MQRSTFSVIFLILIFLLITGCGETTIQPSVTSQPQPSETTAILPTETVLPTRAPTETPAPSPTAVPTAEPSATVTPTLVPTPELPVGPGENLPQPLLTIAADNAFSLDELARYGTARIYGTVMSADRSTIFALTAQGIKAYAAGSMQRLAWFQDLDPLMEAWGIPTWGATSSYDGQRISLLTSKGQAQVYAIDAGLIYSTTLPAFWNPWAALSPDGESLAVPKQGEDEWSAFWHLVNIEDGSLIADGIGMNVRFSPQGTYLVGDASDTLYIYRTSDWQEQTQIGLRAGGETALEWSFSPDERYLAVVMPDSVTVWEVETRQRVRLISPVSGAGAQFSQAFFSEDASQLGVVEYIEQVSSNLLVWNIADGSLISRQTPAEAGLYDFDQVLLTPGGLEGYSVPRESDGSGYQAPTYSEWQLAFDLNNVSVSVVDFGWDLESLQPYDRACIFTFEPGHETICHPVSEMMQVTTDGLGHFYSLWQGESDEVLLYSGLEQAESPLITFSTDGYPIKPLGVSPDGSLLVSALGSGGSTLHVLEIQTGRALYIEETNGRIERLSFSDDGTRLAASIPYAENHSPQVLVYDTLQNAVLYRLPAQEMMQGSHALLSPDGQRLVYRFERRDALRWNGIQVWDPLHQQQLAEWEGGVEALGSPMAFSADGRLLATADQRGRVFILDSESGEVLHQWKAHADEVLHVAFSPDGSLLATSGTDGFIRLWGVYP